MSVIKLKTDHFSSHELHSNDLHKTMNPVLITQGPLPASGKYFSFPTETRGENQGHCRIPGFTARPCPLRDAHGHTHARARGHPVTEHVMRRRKPHGPSRGGAGAEQREAGVSYTQLSGPQSVSPGPPSPQALDRLPTHPQGGRAEEMHPPAVKSFHSRPDR